MIKDILSLIKYGLSIVYRLDNISVLMYHSIGDKNKNFSTVSSVCFNWQMKFLKEKSFSVVSVDDLLNYEDKKNKKVCLTFDDGTEDNYFIVYKILKKYNFPAVFFIVYDLVGKDGFLTWDQIVEMKNSGLIEFGCHTMSHPSLDKIDADLLDGEISLAKKKIEEKLGCECRTFSYPKGRFNDIVINKVISSNFKASILS